MFGVEQFNFGDPWFGTVPIYPFAITVTWLAGKSKFQWEKKWCECIDADAYYLYHCIGIYANIQWIQRQVFHPGMCLDPQLCHYQGLCKKITIPYTRWQGYYTQKNITDDSFFLVALVVWKSGVLVLFWSKMYNGNKPPFTIDESQF